MFIINQILKCIKYIFFYNYYTVIMFFLKKKITEPEPEQFNTNPQLNILKFMVVCADKRAAIAAKKF